ncbi:MAG: ribose 5-phosphate isomerase B [Nitrospirae bacterium]|nr:ribose 5-phosphate isomerase B [Nitrospirota bacterium]
MRVVIGSDHAGFELKQFVVAVLRELQHPVADVGTYSAEPADYPDYAEKVGVAIREGKADRGIVICGSGVGASVAANKLPGIRAGLCHDTYSAKQGVSHDAMNVLVLGARVIGREVARELVTAFLSTEFSTVERHVRRLNKVNTLEKKYSRQGEPVRPPAASPAKRTPPARRVRSHR